MKTSKILIGLAAAALIPLGASAADDYSKDKSGSMHPNFEKLDTNGDGRISQTEASVETNLVFSSADVNGDGYLDKSEWKNHEKSEKSATTPAPQSAPMPSTDPAAPESTTPESSEPAPSDTETPRQ
jgi:hypothetical protein